MTKELVLSLESFSREIDCRRPALCLDAAAEIERLERVVADLHHDIASHDCPRLPDEPAAAPDESIVVCEKHGTFRGFCVMCKLEAGGYAEPPHDPPDPL